MAWEHLSVNKPHLVYLILGGFTTVFMLCSSIIKERLYIGEATVATLVGVIFGPHVADLINPNTWGNTDQITLEFSRIVLVVQCFAVGVELPKYYMEKHWRSVVFLLVPVMTFGWLITSLFIWAMFMGHMDWLDSLCCAACVTATDPVLASSVVGKGKFAKRVPKHLRDILSAESGCNDGMAFPFIYLAVYILKYKGHPSEVALHWFCYTILYECVFGAVYGVAVGYIARRFIRIAHEREYIDRESFLVFYFVLALFCAGSGSLLGMDDLLIGFACGVGFSNDGWFSERTEEEQVSNVIDLLLNLAFFVYFGTIIPWDQFNAGFLGLDVWRLVVIALLVLFFRRIPIMLLLKPVIPDVKTWREALFAGHFGPIGVGAIFVAILARAELEDGENTTPLKTLPDAPFEHLNVIELIWPITCFLVMTSIVVHGSSIAVFTLGRHINTLALTMSFSRAQDEPHWMNRLPRIQSRSKSSMSRESSVDERGIDSNMLPLAAAGKLLRRRKEDDDPSQDQEKQSTNKHRSRRSRKRESGHGPGGPVSQSAIEPARREPSPSPEKPYRSDSDTLALKSESSPSSEERDEKVENEKVPDEACSIHEEGDDTVFEDKEGNVLAVEQQPEGEDQLQREVSEIDEAKRLARKEGADQNEGVAPTKDRPETIEEEEREKDVPPPAQASAGEDKAPDNTAANVPAKRWKDGMQKMSAKGWLARRETEKKAEGQSSRGKSSESNKEGAPARAYQYGNTIIIENEDGEVIKKYEIPNPERKQSTVQGQQHTTRQRLESVSLNMGKLFGVGKVKADGKVDAGAPGPEDSNGPASSSANQALNNDQNEDDDQLVRFTTGGRRMSKVEFIEQFRDMDPKRRLQAVEESNLPEATKREARKQAREQAGLTRTSSRPDVPTVQERPESESESESESADGEQEEDFNARRNSDASNELRTVQSNVPSHDISSALRSYQIRSGEGETAAERRRRVAMNRPTDEDSDDDGTDRVPPASGMQHHESLSENVETAAEKRRRLGALGLAAQQDNDSDSDDDDTPREIQQPQAVRFADQSSSSNSRPGRLRWASNLGAKH